MTITQSARPDTAAGCAPRRAPLGLAPAPVRRVSARAAAPPYDDELPEDTVGASVPGALPLPLDRPSDRVPRLRVVPAPGSTPVGQRLAPPGPWSTRFVRAVLESMAGLRPVAQLGAWASADVCRLLARRVSLTERCRDVPRHIATLRSIHVSTTSEDVAEVCAVVDDGARVRAVALRIEARSGRWRCTDLQVG